MAINKVVYGGSTLIDLTEDTVTADKLLAGYTAHDKRGVRITGTASGGTDTSDATLSSGGQMLEGITAYAKGLKYTGTIETYDGTTTPGSASGDWVDTSDATLNSGDQMLEGVTAYAQGSKFTGSIQEKAAQTYTPGTTNQTIASGQYLAGAQTIKGDANLVAANIASGISIFGVTGTHGGGGGGGDTVLLSLLSRTIQSFSNSIISYLGENAFRDCELLNSVFIPEVSYVGSSAFQGCTRMTTLSAPSAKRLYTYAFYQCSSLAMASFPSASSIYASAFRNCLRLTSLYLTGSSVCSLAASGAFSSTPIGGYSATAGKYGSIYVPASLLASYKAATNWTYFSARMVGT